MAVRAALRVAKGGPLAGLPSFTVTFEEEKDELSPEPLALLSSMSPPPRELRIMWLSGALGQQESLALLLSKALSLGMTTVVETFEILPWMLDRMVNWRILHTASRVVSFPVEEIVLHGDAPFVLRPFPFHLAVPPRVWAFSVADIRTVPPGVGLWVSPLEHEFKEEV